MRAVLRGAALLAAALSAACGDRACGGRGGLPPAALPTVKRGDGLDYRVLDKGAWKGFYDGQGRIAVVEYDSNGDGRADYIAHYDERRQIRLIEVDEDHDSWVDRFEHYDAAGVLEKVGRWRKQRGRADEWTYRAPDGRARPHRVRRRRRRQGRAGGDAAGRGRGRGSRPTPTATAAPTAGSRGSAAGWWARSSTRTATAGPTGAWCSVPARGSSGSSASRDEPPRPRAEGARALPVLVLVLLAAGPLLAGAVHEPVFVPLLVGCAAAGLWAWGRARVAARQGRAVPPLPAFRLLLALHALLLFQLVPLPPAVLARRRARARSPSTSRRSSCPSRAGGRSA